MTEIKNAVFLGSKSLGLSILKTLHGCSKGIKWTIIHPEDSKDDRSNLSDFQGFARLHDLDLMIATSAAAAKQMLSDLRPDIGFVCGWYWLLDAETLSRVQTGLWGMHNSLLPKYRGGAPLVWSIINGDQTVGCSVFKISEGMDDGKILYQVSVDNSKEDDVGSLLKKIESGLRSQLPGKWAELVTGTALLASQNETDATYCGQRIGEDGLIDWLKPANEIHDFIRAQTRPYPCAFSFLSGTELRFIKSRALHEKYFGTPGQLLRTNGDSSIVSCGDHTALEILEISVLGEDVKPSSILKSVKHRLTNGPRSTLTSGTPVAAPNVH